MSIQERDTSKGKKMKTNIIIAKVAISGIRTALKSGKWVAFSSQVNHFEKFILKTANKTMVTLGIGNVGDKIFLNMFIIDTSRTSKTVNALSALKTINALNAM